MSLADASRPPSAARRPLLPIALCVLGLALWLGGGRVLADGDAGRVAAGLGWLALLASAALRLRGQPAHPAEASAARGLALATAGVVTAQSLWLAGEFLGLGTASDAAGFDAARVATLLNVAWVLILAVALPVLLFLEHAWQSMPVAHALEPRRMRAAGESGAVLGLTLITLFAVNYAVSQRDVERDLSYFRTTVPGPATTQLLQRSEAELEALLFFAPVDHVLDAVEPYFAALAAAQPKLRYRVVDHVREPELARRLKVRGNGWVVVRKVPNAAAVADAAALAAGASPTDVAAGKAKADAAAAAVDNPGETFEIGEDLERARRNLRKLDGLMHKAVARLAQPARRLALTRGHGERTREGQSEADGLRGLFELFERFAVDHEELGLSDGLGQRVPEGTRAVAILGARSALLEEEARALLRYVQAGGRLLVLLDPDTQDGLEPLLAGLGVRRLPGIIASERSSMRRRFDESDRTILVSSSYSTHPTVSSASRHAGRVATVLLGAAALEELPADAPGRILGGRVAFPLRAPNDAWLDRDADYQRDQAEAQGRLEVMAAISLPASAAAAGGDTAGQDATKDPDKDAAKDKGEGRVVIIADGDLVSDELIANPGNVLLFVDSLRWLIGDEETSSEIESEEDVPVEHRKDSDRLWFYGTSFGLPLPLLLCGIWLGRRLRRGRNKA